jgi:flavin-dependent dehydrogenase
MLEQAIDADVVVVGAGPVGSVLGMILRHAGLRALVLDRAHFPRDKACGEGLLPAGARLLRELGVDLAGQGFPALAGVRYRLPGRGWVRAGFRSPGYGVRRTRLDELLAARSAAVTGVEVESVRPSPNSVAVETSRGVLRARAVVVADGLRSRIRRQLGWERPLGHPRRYGLVGHLDAPGHGFEEITVTLLGRIETYLAPTSRDQLLLAVLGPQGTLRTPGVSVEKSYRDRVIQTHPTLADAVLDGRVWGCGPFAVSARPVAEGRVFLCGDAAGFHDPLTGDAISAGFAQAEALGRMLAQGVEHAASAYRRWHAAQWRQRRLVGSLALRLATSERLAQRAVDGIARRPGALERLVEVNDGSRSLAALGPRDWAALAGW